MRRLLGCLWLLAWMLAPLSASAQQVDVIISCPIYDSATGDGNNPAMPQDPQPTPFDVSGVKPLLCQVLYGNTSGAPLTNVRFTLRAQQLAIPYVDPAALPGGDPMMTLLYPMEDAFMERRFAPILNGAQPGFPAGVWDNTAGTYTWNLPSIAPGQTGELRVALGDLPPLLANQQLQLRLEVQINGGPVVATRTVPFEIPASRFAIPTPTLRVPGQTARPSSALPGNLTGNTFVGSPTVPGSSGGRADYDREVIIYLPWLNTATNTIQNTGFSSTNAAHVRLHNPAQMKAELFIGSYVPTAANDFAYYNMTPGQSGAPASGPNAGRVLRYDAATNTLRARVGRIGPQNGYLVSWRAPLVPRTLPGAITSFTTRACHTSALTRVVRPLQPEYCTSATTSLVDEEGAPSSPFLAEFNGNNQHNEARALLPYSILNMRFGGGYNTSRPATGGRIIFQMPGDSQRRADVFAIYTPTFRSRYVPDPRPAQGVAIYVSTRPSAYGSQSNLASRPIPTSSAADWRRCDDAIAGQPAGVKCEYAHMQAIGVDPKDVTEVRIDTPEFHPFSLLHGIYEVRTQLDGTALSSIDGMSPPNTTTMVGASVGATFRFDHTAPNGTTVAGYRSNWAEVQAGSAFGYGNLSPYGELQTTEVRRGFFIPFRNRGPGPVYGPITLRVQLPLVGFEYDNSTLSPAEPLRPYVRWGYHVNQSAGADQLTVVDMPTTEYSYTWDAATKELVITFNLNSVGGQLNGNVEPGSRPLNAPSDISVYLDGIIRIGAPRRLEPRSISLSAEITNPDGTRGPVTLPVNALPFYNVTSVAPALAVSAASSPDPAPGYGLVTTDYTLTNSAYRADGTRIPNGATGSARGVVLYHRVTRDGDFGLTGRSTFESASSPDAQEIWVRADEPMMGQKGDSAALLSGGWVFCAQANMPCDAAALATLGIAPAQVRWVAFNMGEVLVTDAAPRGTAPLGGVMRQEIPYAAQVVVRDAGSPQDAILRAQGELFSQDTAPTSTAEMELDVVINAACDARDPSVGAGLAELCDGKDNDCDGDIDEDFADLGTMCEAGLGACRNQGPVVCAPDGMSTLCAAVAGQPQGAEICDGMDNDCDDLIDEGFDELQASCQVDGGGGCMVQGAGACAPDGMSVICQPLEPGDMDGDRYLDVCDCAPGDATRYSMTPGEPASCDADGDGACDGALTGVNPAICLVAGDCDDDDAARAPGLAELCDGLDQDCDGVADEEFVALGLGQGCEVGQGACEASGVYVCGEDGDGVVCDAIAGEPSEEVCDAVDNDCDGAVDEGAQGVQLCEPPAPPSFDVSGDGAITCHVAPAGGAAGVAGSLWWLSVLAACGLVRRRRGCKE